MRCGPPHGAVLLAMLVWGVLAPARGAAATPVGAVCAMRSECGSAPSVCLEEYTRRSGSQAWIGGYCSEDCSAEGSVCPTGSLCTQAFDGTWCLRQCQPGTGDCRQGYTCVPLDPGGNVCFSSCGRDLDCAAGYTCRACDGLCIAQQNPGVLVGDPCAKDSECGTGQLCLKIDGHAQGLCSQPCGTGTCACPSGTTCQQVGSSRASMCVRTCSASTCAAELQCAPFPEGATGCLPSCRSGAPNDCPTGSTCGNGQCRAVGSTPDGGCALCGDPPDAGTPAPDAGTGPGGTAGPGCGCQGSAVNAPGFLGALALFLVAARRRRCQRL